MYRAHTGSLVRGCLKLGAHREGVKESAGDGAAEG